MFFILKNFIFYFFIFKRNKIKLILRFILYIRLLYYFNIFNKMDCRKYGNCNPYNKDLYQNIYYSHSLSGSNIPNIGRYPYNIDNQPYKNIKYYTTPYLTDSTANIKNGGEYGNGIYHINNSFNNNLDSTIYGDIQQPIGRLSPGEYKRIKQDETIGNARNIEKIKLDPEKIMYLRKYFFTTPIKRPNDKEIISRMYIDILRYGTIEEIEYIINLAKKGIYYSNNHLEDNEVRYQNKIYDCEKLNKVAGGNCLDDITSSIPHAMCGAKYKYLLNKNYDKCGLDEGCPKDKCFANGTMTCIKDFEQAVKDDLLDDQAYNNKLNEPIKELRTRKYNNLQNRKDEFTARPYFENFGEKQIGLKHYGPQKFESQYSGKQSYGDQNYSTNSFDSGNLEVYKIIPGKPTNSEVNEVAINFDNSGYNGKPSTLICGNVTRKPYSIGQYIEYTPINRDTGLNSVNYWKQKGWSSRYIPENNKYRMEFLINKHNN